MQVKTQYSDSFYSNSHIFLIADPILYNCIIFTCNAFTSVIGIEK